jgi:hypothetical protein
VKLKDLYTARDLCRLEDEKGVLIRALRCEKKRKKEAFNTPPSAPSAG